MVWSENFHFKQFPGQTRRERRAFDAGEPRAQISPHPRRVGEIAPSSSRRRDRPTEIIGAIVLVLNPKLIGAVVTDLVLIAHQRRCYRSRSRSWPKAHRRCRSRRLDLIAPMISSSQSRLDLIVVSLSLKFLITLSSSLSQFDQICMKSVEVLSRFLFL